MGAEIERECSHSDNYHQYSSSFLQDPLGSENPFADLLNELGPADVGVSLHCD